MQQYPQTAQGDLEAIFGGSSFDPYTHESAADFEAVPPGKYPVLVEKAELRPTKKGDGNYLYLVLSILDGEYKNRKIFDRLNIDNPNVQAVEIALKVLTAAVKAIGFTGDDWKYPELWVNKVLIAHVTVGKGQNGGEQNNVRTYSSPDEAQPQTGDAGLPTPAAAAVAPQAAGPAPASPTGPAAQGGAPAQPTGQRPWDRKAA